MHLYALTSERTHARFPCGVHAMMRAPGLCFVAFYNFTGQSSAAASAPPFSTSPLNWETACTTSHTSYVTRHTSHVTRHKSHVSRHTSHVTRHMSHVTRHMSHVTRHTSHTCSSQGEAAAQRLPPAPTHAAEAHTDTDTHSRHVAQAVCALVQAHVKRRQAAAAAAAAAANFSPPCRPQHLAHT